MRPRFNHILFLLLLAAGIARPALGQPFSTRIYTSADGLPDANINSIYQDTKGYLWLGTRTSLCRFNGYGFVNYGKQVGGGTFTGSLLLEDSRHRMWVQTRNGVALLKSKKLRWFPTSDGLKVGWLFSLTELSGGRVWMLSDKGIYEFADSVWQKRNLVKAYTDLPCRYAVEGPAGIYLNYGHQLFLYQTNGVARPLTPRQAAYPYYVWLKKYHNAVYVNTFEGLYRVENDSLVRLFKKQLNNVYSYDFLLDSKKRMWISTEKDGLLVSDPGNETELAHKIPLAFNLTLLFTEDREGNVWASNYEGLLRIRKSGLSRFDEEKNPLLTDIRHLAVKPDGSLLVKSATTGFLVYRDGRFLEDSDFATNEELRRAVVDASVFDASGDLWLVTRFGKLLRVGKSGTEEFNKQFPDEFFQYVTYDPTDRTVYVCGQKLYAVRNGRLTVLPQGSAAGGLRPRRIYRSGGHTVVYAGDSGVYRFGENGNSERLPQLAAANPSTNDFRLLNDPNGGFWTVSFAEGLRKFSWEKNGPVKRFSLSVDNGLPNNYVVAFTFDGQGRLWVTTLSGLVVVEKNGAGGYTVNRIDDEALSRFHNWIEAQLAADKQGAVWLSSFHEVIRFDTKNISFDDRVPAVVLSDVQLNLQPTDWTAFSDSVDDVSRLPAFAVLPHNQNTVSFSFDALTFSHNDNCLFAYRLDGLDKNWQSATANRSVSFANLAPGAYTFRVKARKPNTAWSRETQFAFVIRRPFWTTWWFQLLLILCAAGIIAGYVRLRIRRIRTRAAVEKQLQALDLKALKAANALMNARQELANAEMQALRAQMNPHFIYNALNSIQSLVFDGRQSEAVKYIGKFARLLRQVLEHSDNNLITLEKELSILQLYVQLEALRLNKELLYTTEMDEQLLPEKEMVPPLVIQPYVENALWHGLSRKEGECRLWVHVWSTEDWLFVKIGDNGIGRQQAALHKKEQGISVPSRGMHITEQRLNTLNGELQGQPVTVTDLFDEDGRPAGTEVTLRMVRTTKA